MKDLTTAEKREKWDTCSECGYLEGTNSACYLCHHGFVKRSRNHDKPIEP